MSKVAHYLQEHLTGEVMISSDARRFFSTDGSILTTPPAAIVYPRNENDVRKTARFTWQLAERGRVIPLTARGLGTDQAGAAIGNGIVLAFPAHMHRILELDDKNGVVIVEPGTNYGKLQQVLHTHGKFMPPYPASLEYSSIGGAVANDASGQKSVKYGTTRDYVRSMRVVLANGEVIETGRINKRELSKKLGLSSFEGEIYRGIDVLLEENHEQIEKMRRDTTRNSAGYALGEIKHKDGSFDLTPLFVGSQGTLGIITELTIETENFNPATTLIVAQFDDLEDLQAAVMELRKLPEMPSAIEMVDQRMLNLVESINPNLLKNIVSKPTPKVVLLIELDDPSERGQRKSTKRARKILENHDANNIRIELELVKQEELWKIRQASATALTYSDNGSRKALPIIEDGIVPPERLREFIEGIYQILDRNQLNAGVWGSAGDANLHVLPHFDISQVGDRQKAFRVMDEYYNLIVTLGGSTSAGNGDGRLRAPYLEKLYGPESYALFVKVKQIFDPYNTLSPGVKLGTSLEGVKQILRSNFSLDHLYSHLPRS